MVYFKAHLLLALGDCKGVREEEVKPGYPTLKKQQQVKEQTFYRECEEQDQVPTIYQIPTLICMKVRLPLSIEQYFTHTPPTYTN